MIIQTDKPMRERDPHDFYPTCSWAVDVALKEVLPLVTVFTRDMMVLDPGAGTGIWGERLRLLLPTADITGVEIREDAMAHLDYNDWFTMPFEEFNTTPYDLIIGNPPYALAQEFIEHSMDLAANHGVVAMLLRLAFLEGQKRAKEFYPKYMPYRVLTYSARPSFMPVGHPKEGKTDATAYAFFIWRKNAAQKYFQGGWLHRP